MDRDDQEHFRKLAVAPVRQAAGSSKLPSVASSDLTRDPKYALQKATIICGCYRKNEVEDAEVYIAALAALLSQYPIAVIDYVADPRTGIASSCKWLPSLAEVKDLCENRANLLEKDAERQARREAQIEQTEAFRREQAERSSHLTYDDLKAKYGSDDGWGIDLATDKRGEEERKARTEAAILRGNAAVFERECAHAGIDPARGVSPSLLKLLEAQNGPRG